MSKIIIIRGNSGSGKTTVSKALQAKIPKGTLLIPHDLVRMVMFGEFGDAIGNPSIKLLENLVAYGHQNCDLVILEGILNSYIYKDLFVTIEKLFNGQIFAYYFDLPFEETVKRHAQRDWHEFGEKEMREWWREKDFIINIREKIISKEMSLDETVERIYQDITSTAL